MGFGTHYDHPGASIPVKTNNRNILFVLLAYAAGLMTAYVLCNSLTAYRNERITSLEREVTRLDSLVNQATEILHHERLMHLGIASGDVERIMREKASTDADK